MAREALLIPVLLRGFHCERLSQGGSGYALGSGTRVLQSGCPIAPIAYQRNLGFVPGRRLFVRNAGRMHVGLCAYGAGM